LESVHLLDIEILKIEGKNMKAIITTSANPFHYGHLDIFNKAKKIFEDVRVIVAQNSEKAENKSIEHHLRAYNIPFTIIHDKTVADYCNENDVKYIVRGIRNGVDAEYELKLDFANREINPNIQTLFIPTTDVYSNISSSTIRELLKYQKYDIVKKYMDGEAMRRYIYGHKYDVYFGRSCVGKTTYLNNNNIKSINIDTYLWDVANKIHGEYQTNKFKEDSRHLIYSDQFTPEEKLKILHNQDSCFFTNKFWETFFMQIPSGYTLDWAAVGMYWFVIPEEYRAQMKFIEIDCPEKDREERIIFKGFEDKIYFLDSIYIKPPIIDKKIMLAN
jgi:pantetheine-phosphate adenylyltransferase